MWVRGRRRADAWRHVQDEIDGEDADGRVQQNLLVFFFGIDERDVRFDD